MRALLRVQSFHQIPVYVVHFVPASKILHASFDANARPSNCFKICPDFQTLGLFLKSFDRAFKALIENWKPALDIGKLNRVFENHGQTSKELISAACLCASHEILVSPNILLYADIWIRLQFYSIDYAIFNWCYLLFVYIGRVRLTTLIHWIVNDRNL